MESPYDLCISVADRKNKEATEKATEDGTSNTPKESSRPPKKERPRNEVMIY